ncbi:hypothetical protein [Aliarcobacter butzleri]|uniref:hypothetical protein n=1 Tax=Aliarcobacter butzleri TaxID=28197 RepID=UPI002B248BED|nr:hypothetical protein [Aliarcobacter butzleri]
MSDDIQKNEDIKGGQIAQTVQGDQNQINNNYSLNTFSKPLKNYNEPIKVKSQSITYKNNFYEEWYAKTLFGFVIVIIFANMPNFIYSVFSVLNFFNFKVEAPKDLKYMSLNLIAISIMIFAFYLAYKLFNSYLNSTKDNSILYVKENCLILNNNEIEYSKMRMFLKENFMFNYQFFIFEETKKEATIKFSTNETDTAIAIEELLKHQINKAIKKSKKVKNKIKQINK